ncbi:conserved hypothetical protein [Pseudomonas sp. IT-347P]|uniref:Vps62-related protein n=1 Tax=Pseudomonas sp. IT-347P TaxID=3026458 RepID=UPI0039E0E029
MTIEENAASLPRPMQPITHDNLLINFTTEFHRVWSTNGSKVKPGAFWRPTPARDALPGYFPLGDQFMFSNFNINGEMVSAVVCEKDLNGERNSKGNALAKPADFELVWKESSTSSATRASIWRPIAPVGYVAMGLVCANDHSKPSLNTIRCVRADLVVEAKVGDLLWNDKGTGAKLSFSAWAIEPPTAEPGEICFAPGTFVGVPTYSKPTTPGTAYALRMQIPLQIKAAPQAPALTGYAHPGDDAVVKVTQIARLPWFAVRDHANPAEQFFSSPYYELQRTDEYVLIGYDHNTSDKTRPAKWTAHRAQNPIGLRKFSGFTSIEIAKAWPSVLLSDMRVLKLSARLPEHFTHTKSSASGWNEMRPQVVVAMVAKQTAVAVFQMESHYRLIREDGTQVAVEFGYTDDSSIHLTQYPPEQIEIARACPQPTGNTPSGTEASAVVDVIAPSSLERPSATDTAP